MTDDGRKALADRLLTMAARRSVETTFGWAHPDCADLQQAARVVRGDPEPVHMWPIEGVLSEGNIEKETR